WNSSKVIGASAGTGAGGGYSGNINAGVASAYDWNISVNLPNGLSGWRIDRANLDDMMLLVQGSFGAHPNAPFGTYSLDGANVTAISLKPDSLGNVLWNKHFDTAPNNVTRSLANWDPANNVFIIADKETAVMYGYSLTDGSFLWGPKGPATAYAYFRTFPAVAYGKIYFTGYGGILYAYDVKTGDLLWTYGNGGPGNSTFGGLEVSYGYYPTFIDVIADGKVFLGTTEHSPNSPYYKDAKYRAINATDGTEVWTLMGWGTGMDTTYDRVADGFFVFMNSYDMQVYSVGKGPSALTVEAPMSAIAKGSSLVIRGTVTDVSAGTKQKEQAARFPNGVPAVSDESMEAWMEYVYMQKPKPVDATGVPIDLNVVDANGNFREIGTTTSNNGFFTFNWKPDIEGQYIVYASFAGSESYWPSNAMTSFVVDPAAPTPTSTETPTQSAADMYFVPAVAAITIVIIIGFAILAILMLRKRP
ncbi:MAG TPA: PQQ-binding-like beta-propeller repeat protein, partial [Candidatus Bathyarchaeia archaeon]